MGAERIYYFYWRIFFCGLNKINLSIAKKTNIIISTLLHFFGGSLPPDGLKLSILEVNRLQKNTKLIKVLFLTADKIFLY